VAAGCSGTNPGLAHVVGDPFSCKPVMATGVQFTACSKRWKRDAYVIISLFFPRQLIGDQGEFDE
jgi:hypothetical protein